MHTMNMSIKDIFVNNKMYASGFNGQILDWERVNALAVKFVDAFKKQGESLYITKLLKLFFYFDFVSYKRNEKPFTGDIYCKLPYGPIPSIIKDQLDLLKQGNDENEELTDIDLKSMFAKYLEAEQDEVTKGYKLKIRQDVDIPKEEFNDYFSESDSELFNTMVEAFKNKTVNDIVEMTHQEVPYTKVKRDTGVINYLLAYEEEFPKALPNYRAV